MCHSSSNSHQRCSHGGRMVVAWRSQRELGPHVVSNQVLLNKSTIFWSHPEELSISMRILIKMSSTEHSIHSHPISHIHTHAHTYTHTPTHMHTQTNTHTHTYTHVYIRLHLLCFLGSHVWCLTTDRFDRSGGRNGAWRGRVHWFLSLAPNKSLSDWQLSASTPRPHPPTSNPRGPLAPSVWRGIWVLLTVVGPVYILHVLQPLGLEIISHIIVCIFWGANNQLPATSTRLA